MKSELGITVSVGVSFNKIFAKLGSDYKKPDAITTMYKSEFKQKAWSLPVADLLYVGKSTNRKLALFGIKTIGDLARTDEDVLNSHLGKIGSILWSFANGYDDSPVKLENTHAPIKSVGNSTTTPKDLVCDEDVKIVLYQTIGAGQNLQYKIPKARKVVQLGEFTEGDKRFLYKDFDALYLGNITNMTVNTYQDEKITSHDLLQMLFQIEELYESSEMNYSEKDQMLKLAFRSYTGSDQFTLNKLYKLKSVVVQASRMVLQAVGRMCRTFVKSPDIYLFVESELLEKLYVGELKKRILPPEMKAIVDMRESLGKDYLPEENFMLNKAEKISSVGLWTIRRMLAKDWTAESMQLWEQLRLLVLQYPTASAYDWQNNEYLQKLYITSGEKRNQYIYSQYSDFNDVTIDFGNDKVAFKNSKRAKIKGNSDEVAIYEMSEKESGLQAILRYPGMKAHFEEMGYALKFEMNEYLLSPVLFHNIYKGALGEVAGKFILNRELGIELSPITEPEYFEFFDYKLSSDVYVDFKNWKFTYVQDRDEIRKDILRKLEAMVSGLMES